MDVPGLCNARHIFHRRVWYSAISLRYHPHTLHVGYLCPNFVSVAPSIAELACGEKLCTQSLNHSLSHSVSLFDAPWTEAFASEYNFSEGCCRCITYDSYIAGAAACVCIVQWYIGLRIYVSIYGEFRKWLKWRRTGNVLTRCVPWSWPGKKQSLAELLKPNSRGSIISAHMWLRSVSSVVGRLSSACFSCSACCVWVSECVGFNVPLDT